MRRWKVPLFFNSLQNKDNVLAIMLDHNVSFVPFFFFFFPYVLALVQVSTVKSYQQGNTIIGYN